MYDIQVKYISEGKSTTIKAECSLSEVQNNFLVIKSSNGAVLSIPYVRMEIMKINDIEVKDFSKEGIEKVLFEIGDSGSSSGSFSSDSSGSSSDDSSSSEDDSSDDSSSSDDDSSSSGAEPEPDGIWIKFKFLDKTYNPAEHNLAVGTANSNGKDCSFKASWELFNEKDNIWIWNVTEGTDLTGAFAYAVDSDDEDEDPQYCSLIMSETGDNAYDNFPVEDFKVSLGNNITNESLKAKAELHEGYIAWRNSSHTSFTGDVEILAWNLRSSTNLSCLFGDAFDSNAGPNFRTSIVGSLPALAFKIHDEFDEDLESDECRTIPVHDIFAGGLYSVTSMGDITLLGPYYTKYPYDSDIDLRRIFHSMTGLTRIPKINFEREFILYEVFINNVYYNCVNASLESMEQAYNSLYDYYQFVTDEDSRSSITSYDNFYYCGWKTNLLHDILAIIPREESGIFENE